MSDNFRRVLKSFLPAAVLSLCAVSQADLTFKVDCRSSYLLTSEYDAGIPAPTKIKLSEIGIVPGDVITITEKGKYSQAKSWPEDTDVIGAVFSTNDKVLDYTVRHRVPGALRAGTALISPVQFAKQFFTDIPEDFAVSPSGTKVVVPSGAQYLIVGAIDSSYDDNSSTKGITVTLSVVGKASGKGRNALSRLIPASTGLASGATGIAPNGLVSGWVAKGDVFQAAIFKGGSFTSSGIFGENGAIAYAVSPNGTAVGSALLKGEVHPFVADKQAVDPLGTGGEALAINNSGVSAGYQSIWGGFNYPFVTIKGKAVRIETNWNQGTATAINSKGDVVGYMTNQDGWKNVAWISTDGKTPTAVPLAVPASVSAYPVGINDRGQIVGNYVSPNNWLLQPYRQPVRAFIYDKSGFKDLGTLPGGDSVEAAAINNQGQIVGAATTAEGETHAFVYADGKMTDLGTLDGTDSYATGINEAGDIVGYALDAKGVSQAFSTKATSAPAADPTVSLSINYFPEGSTVKATLSLGAAAATDLTVPVTSSKDGLLKFDSKVTIKKGQTSVTFDVTANQVEANTPFTLSAVVNGKTLKAPGTVRSLALSIFRLNNYTVKPGGSLTGMLTLESAALTGGKTIKLSTDTPGVALPATALIAAGKTDATFTLKVGNVAIGAKVTVIAKCGDRESRTIFTVTK